MHETDDALILDFYTAPPGGGEPTADNPATRCSTLERAKPPGRPPEQVCVVGACLIGPGEAREVGCVRRGDFTHRFRVRLRTSARRRLRVRLVRFRLDRRRNGSDRRSPFMARVRGTRLAPGPHVLAAEVRLARRGSRRVVRRTLLRYRFDACE